MVHAVFDRPNARFKVFDEHGALATDTFGALEFEAGGDAWGGPGYGHDGWCPPGHYVLGPIDTFDPPIVSEGAAQIYVLDFDGAGATLHHLVAAGKAHGAESALEIGGLIAPIGRLAAYDREGIMIHAGGSNAPDPFAAFQMLCRTEGCTRLHNADLARLVAWLRPRLAENIAIYTIIGDPLPLAA